MASTPQTTTAPVTEDAFLTDRQAFLGSFLNFTLGIVIFLVILLILMRIFLV